jgi:hypothetical protein
MRGVEERRRKRVNPEGDICKVQNSAVGDKKMNWKEENERKGLSEIHGHVIRNDASITLTVSRHFFFTHLFYLSIIYLFKEKQ